MDRKSDKELASTMTLEELIEYSKKNPEQSLRISKLLVEYSNIIFNPRLLFRV